MCKTTDKMLFQVLWILLAVTFPLFSVSFLRVDVGMYHFAAPAAILSAIFAGYILKILIQGATKRVLFPRGYEILGILCYLFFLWHSISVFKAVNPATAVKEVFRVMTGLICFWGVVAFFPREKKFVEKFFVVLFWSMGLLLSVCIYKYAFVFRVPFLGTNLDYITRYGKNQLAYFLAKVVPFAFFYTWYARRKMLSLIPLIIMIISLVYTSSRGAWIAVVAGFILSSLVRLVVKRREGMKLAITVFVGFPMMVGFVLFIMSHFVNLSGEILVRVNSIFSPEKLETHQAYLGKYSYSHRWNRFAQALDGFLLAPASGVGLGNTTEFVVGLAHNDYVAILLQLGLIGLVLHIGILGHVCKRMIRVSILERRATWWALLGAEVSLVTLAAVSVFYDNYASLYYWLFLALYVVVVETEKRSFQREMVSRVESSQWRDALTQ